MLVGTGAASSALLWALGLAGGAAAGATDVSSTYPLSYTSCGIEHALQASPSRVVTMNQGVTEFMLAMGLEDRLVGTAYLDDEIWPRYASAYARVPVLSSSYPSESAILDANADFIIGSYKSAFREKECDSCRGIFSNITVSPCSGAGSDWFETGSNTTTSYSTCRPQLHAAGIGTWLEPVSCEDSALQPQGGATEETVYAAIRQLGEIFDVRDTAARLISEIQIDFDIAENTVQSFTGELDAVWLDCIDCCRDGNGDVTNELVFVGAGTGAPNLIMKEAGLTNAFAGLSGSWACVNVSDVLAADPDVMVIVDAAWDSALEKVDFLYNHSGFCEARFVQQADLITIPFSASTLGPRNGAAALDMVSAAIHVIHGDVRFDFQSGVKFLDPEVLRDRTANLRCPLKLEDVAYTPTFPPPPSPPVSPPPPAGSGSDDLPTWAVIVILVMGVLFVFVLAAALVMFRREKQGNPLFVPLEMQKMPQNAKPNPSPETGKA